jgi:hypothetical protein
MAGVTRARRSGVTIGDAVKRATSLDTKLREQIDRLYLPPAHEIFSSLRAYLIRRANEVSIANNPWISLKFRKVTNGISLIVLGPTIEKGSTSDHFHFDSGARLSFGLTLREQGRATQLVSFRYHYQLPVGASPIFLRFDLNPSANEDPLNEPLCHLHPGLEEVRLPLSLHDPLEILDRIFFVVDKNLL